MEQFQETAVLFINTGILIPKARITHSRFWDCPVKELCFMKKISIEYLLYYLQIVFIGMFLMILLAYNLNLSAQDFLSREMFSENVKGIQLSNSGSDSENSDELNLSLITSDNDFMLYKYISGDYDEIIRGIYGTADVFDFSNYISEGRFFNSGDYNNKTHTAVIGSNMLSKTIKENGKYYFGYSQELFEVIGIFKQTDKNLDNCVYLNLTCILEKDSFSGLYYVDALNEDTVSWVLSAIQDFIPQNSEYYFVDYESINEYGLDSMGNTLYIFSVLAALIHLMLTTIFFITRSEYTIAVQKFCGMTKKSMFIKYGRYSLVLICVSFITIALGVNLFTNFLNGFFSMEQLVCGHFVILGLALFAIGFLITVLTVFLSQKVNISSTLKGR